MAQRRDLDYAAEIIRDWALSRYPDMRPERLKIELAYRDGKIEEVRIPIPLLYLQRTSRQEQSSCRQDILRVLGEIGRRCVTTKLLAEMAIRDSDWSERRVSEELSELVKEGILTNPKVNNRHIGYGLPDWPEE